MVKRLGAEEGVVVKVGQLICDIETDGPSDTPPEAEADEVVSANVEVEQSTQTVEQEPAPAVSRAEEVTEREEHQAEYTEGEMDHSLFASRDAALDTAGSGGQFSGEAAMLPSAPAAGSSTLHGGRVPDRKPAQSWDQVRRIVKASPAVRTYAARLDVDLSEVEGTGEGGRVTKDDIQAFADGQGSSSRLPRNEMSAAVQTDRSGIPPSTKVDFGRTRKVMYRAMGDMGSVPHFGSVFLPSFHPSRVGRQGLIWQILAHTRLDTLTTLYESSQPACVTLWQSAISRF